MTSTREPPLVLVAEDDPLASMAIRAQIEALGLRVLGPARNGYQAVALGNCFPVDVALFDYVMPGRTGLEAAYDLFESAPTPVVILTGLGAADLPQTTPLPPVFGFLSKPIELADLETAIHEARDRFHRWVEDNGYPWEDQREDRATIGRAVVHSADGRRPAEAARLFIDRARKLGTTPLALARSVLTEAP
jgi:CheY-like chemotaxis protein